MANLPSVATYVSTELTRYRSAVSEFLAQTLGKSINYLLNKTAAIETAVEGQNISVVSGFSSSVTGFIAQNSAVYTVPSGYTAYAIIDMSGDAGAGVLRYGTGPVPGPSINAGSPPVYTTLTSGQVITSGSSTTYDSRLFIISFETTTITIP